MRPGITPSAAQHLLKQSGCRDHSEDRRGGDLERSFVLRPRRVITFR